MIRFKQKEFWIGAALNVGTTALTAVGIKQGHDASKQNEELAERQEKDNAKTRAALDRLANSDASPEQKAAAASLFSDLRLFAAPAAGGSVLRNVAGLGRDLWNHSSPGIKKAAKMGAGFAGIGYVGNRIATSWKNHDEGRDDKNVNFLKKAAIGAATIGGGIYAAKKGFFVPNTKFGGAAKNFMSKTGKGGQYLKKAGNFLKEEVSPIGRNKKGNIAVTNPFNLAFMGMPVVGYAAQRMAAKGAANNTAPQPEDNSQQREYAIPGAGIFKSGVNWVKSNGSRFFKGDWSTKKRMMTGGFNKVANTFGMMGGKGGTSAVQSAAEKLAKSDNPYTKKLASWAIKNPNTANVAAGVATIGVGTTAMGVGDKLISKPMRIIDKDAYSIENQENGKV